MRRLFALLVAAATLLGTLTAQTASADTHLDVHQFGIVARESGPTNYYSVVNDPAQPFIRADYPPGAETAVFGIQLPESTRRTARGLHWSWRARVLPKDVGTCDARSGIADTAALVYVIWKRGLRWYTLRYVWSTVAAKGGVCNGKRNMFLAEDTVVLETGAATGGWVSEDLDLAAEFRRHFASGDASADVPDLVGLALMSDGDQTHSESSADYADFVLRN
jgi:Protein of unknown function (DUF3047)